MPEKKQLTRGSLERQIRARVKQAHDKGIVSKVFSAGQAFFHQRYSPDRHYEPEATFVIHQSWDEGSEYTRFDVSVSTFTNISNDARITIRLRMWRWGSGCEVTLIGPDQTQQTVLRVDTTDKRDDPSIIDGHLYACYVLGPWEQLLRVKKLTGVIEQRRKIAAAARVLQERGQQLTGKNTPVSSSDASSARANWGIE